MQDAVLAASVLLQEQHVKGQIRMVPVSPAVKIVSSWMMWILASPMLLQEKKREQCPPGILGQGWQRGAAVAGVPPAL